MLRSATRNARRRRAGALGLAAVPAKAQEFINVLTGGTSGVYYPLGVALSEIYGKGIEGARTQVQATKASVENLNLLQQGKGEIAFALGDSVKLAAGRATPRPASPASSTSCAASPPSIRTTSRSSPRQESGIKTLADLKGKSLSVGAPASGTELNARAIFAAAGMNYEDLGKVEYLPFAESVELIKNRQLDATLQSAGLGVASIRDLATSVPINVVAVPADDRRRRSARPIVAVTIPAGTYDGQAADVQTAAVGNFLVTHDGVLGGDRLPDDQAALREPAAARRRPRRRQGDRPGEGARRHAGPAASGRRALLQGSRAS